MELFQLSGGKLRKCSTREVAQAGGGLYGTNPKGGKSFIFWKGGNSPVGAWDQVSKLGLENIKGVNIDAKNINIVGNAEGVPEGIMNLLRVPFDMISSLSKKKKPEPQRVLIEPPVEPQRVLIEPPVEPQRVLIEPPVEILPEPDIEVEEEEPIPYLRAREPPARPLPPLEMKPMTPIEIDMGPRIAMGQVEGDLWSSKVKVVDRFSKEPSIEKEEEEVIPEDAPPISTIEVPVEIRSRPSSISSIKTQREEEEIRQRTPSVSSMKPQKEKEEIASIQQRTPSVSSMEVSVPLRETTPSVSPAPSIIEEKKEPSVKEERESKVSLNLLNEKLDEMRNLINGTLQTLENEENINVVEVLERYSELNEEIKEQVNIIDEKVDNGDEIKKVYDETWKKIRGIIVPFSNFLGLAKGGYKLIGKIESRISRIKFDKDGTRYTEIQGYLTELSSLIKQCEAKAKEVQDGNSIIKNKIDEVLKYLNFENGKLSNLAEQYKEERAEQEKKEQEEAEKAVALEVEQEPIRKANGELTQIQNMKIDDYTQLKEVILKLENIQLPTDGLKKKASEIKKNLVKRFVSLFETSYLQRLDGFERWLNKGKTEGKYDIFEISLIEEDTRNYINELNGLMNGLPQDWQELIESKKILDEALLKKINESFNLGKLFDEKSEEFRNVVRKFYNETIILSEFGNKLKKLENEVSFNDLLLKRVRIPLEIVNKLLKVFEKIDKAKGYKEKSKYIGELEAIRMDAGDFDKSANFGNKNRLYGMIVEKLNEIKSLEEIKTRKPSSVRVKVFDPTAEKGVKAKELNQSSFVPERPEVLGHPSEDPKEPSTKPKEPSTKPQELPTKPKEPSTKPKELPTKPKEPSTKPKELPTKPKEPSTKPQELPTKPKELPKRGPATSQSFPQGSTFRELSSLKHNVGIYGCPPENKYTLEELYKLVEAKEKQEAKEKEETLIGKYQLKSIIILRNYLDNWTKDGEEICAEDIPINGIKFNFWCLKNQKSLFELFLKLFGVIKEDDDVDKIAQKKIEFKAYENMTWAQANELANKLADISIIFIDLDDLPKSCSDVNYLKKSPLGQYMIIVKKGNTYSPLYLRFNKSVEFVIYSGMLLKGILMNFGKCMEDSPLVKFVSVDK